MPTPRGQEELPAPPAAPLQPQQPQQPQQLPLQPQPQPPQPPQQPQQPQPQQPQPPAQPTAPALPEGQINPLPADRIVPPEGLLIPKKPLGDSLEKPGQAVPAKPAEGELPGLPGEPKSPAPKDKPTTEPSSGEKTPSAPAKDSPKPTTEPKSQNPQSSIWNGDRQPSKPAATAARGTGRNDLFSLIGGVEPEQNSLRATAHRADSIDAAAPATPTHRVEPTGYTTAESSPSAANHPTAGYATAESSLSAADAAKPQSSPALAPAAGDVALPRVALDGYCPVELCSHSRWALGDLRWTVVYKGWIYRLSGTEQRRLFLADPDRFAPANSCNDPVLTVDENRMVPGLAAFCAQYNDRVYMFSSAATQAQFNKNPQRYAALK